MAKITSIPILAVLLIGFLVIMYDLHANTLEGQNLISRDKAVQHF